VGALTVGRRGLRPVIAAQLGLQARSARGYCGFSMNA